MIYSSIQFAIVLKMCRNFVFVEGMSLEFLSRIGNLITWFLYVSQLLFFGYRYESCKKRTNSKRLVE